MTADTPPPTNDDSAMAAIRLAYQASLARAEHPFRLADAFPVPSDLAALYADLARLKGYLDSLRPFYPAQIANMHGAFDTEYTYHSNKIEGNTLTLRETDLVINKGMTISGKSVREHLEAVNHAEAIAVMRELADRREDVTLANLNRIHGLILQAIDRQNAGCFRTVPVYIRGSRHVPPNSMKVPDLMAGLFAFYDAHKATMHPVELAAHMHEKLATIHPYIDGNGRTARLLMNLILLRNGYPIAIIAGDHGERQTYYNALEAANLSATNDNREFQRFIGEIVHRWIIRYLAMVSVDASDRLNGRGHAFLQAIAPHLAAKA